MMERLAATTEVPEPPLTDHKSTNKATPILKRNELTGEVDAHESATECEPTQIIAVTVAKAKS